jgi:hypothetical protein
LATAAGAATFSYHVVGDDPGAWPGILASVGLTAAPTGVASVFVVRSTSALTAAQWLDRAERGAFVVLEGDSALARELGFVPSKKRVVVRGVEDLRSPKLEIVWEKPLAVPVFATPSQARVFVRERWEQAPLMAGFRKGPGGVLWLATSPGTQGHERFPYLIQALADLGFEPPFRSARLWAFFDSSYRSRVDLDYFAERWRKAGIGTLHVAAWHYYDADPQNDEYLKRLMEACHKQAILVYAWLELPHVSEKFWNDHPEWREQTALQQDAQLDWRKLMNLTNRDAFHAVSEGVRSLLGRFDWDGVNLAELYFESLEGYANPARFTPMNADVRAAFQARQGYDPLELFDANSPRHPSRDAAGMRALLEFRAELARKQQTEWMGEMEAVRRNRPDLDLVLTHVDDRFDTRMRDLIGADASRVLPLLSQHDFTFLIEDPATIWNLGPQRYPQIAAAYAPLTPRGDKLAIDINIVDRYQDVYPTKQQTGTELFQLVHLSADAFPRVALYFENSILKQDLPFLASAASTVTRLEQTGNKLSVDSKRGVGIPWQGPALVDGHVWPVRDDKTLWLPPGPHVIEPGAKEAPALMTDFNGTLQSASATAGGLEFAYESPSRALAKLNHTPRKLEIDGAETKPEYQESTLVLPRGQHIVTLSF